MRRAVVYAAAIALLLSGGATAATEAPVSTRLVDSLAAEQAKANRIDREDECRFKNVGTRLWSTQDVERTIRCVAAREDVDAGQALSVWRCESSWAYEPPHDDCCHGPMQYMIDTFRGQWNQLKDAIRRRYGEVAGRVHNVRANVTTAVVFIGHGGSWSPTWSCA